MAKVYSAPVPNRAAADTRLRSLHFRLLIEIAAHDRMTKNGLGYLHPIRVTALRLNEDHSNVGKAIRDLLAWGYLVELPHPTRAHKQARMLAIVYTAEDRELLQNRGDHKPRPRSSSRGVISPRLKSETVVAAPKTVVEAPNFRPRNHRVASVEDTHLKVSEDTPVKQARRENRSGQLAAIERRHRSDPDCVTDADVELLELIRDQRSDDPDTTYHWASRLLDEIDPDNLRGCGAGR